MHLLFYNYDATFEIDVKNNANNAQVYILIQTRHVKSDFVLVQNGKLI